MFGPILLLLAFELRPHVELKVDGPQNVVLGEKARFTVQVHNTGRTAVHHLKLRDRIPSHCRFVSADGNAQYLHSRYSVNWTRDKLDPGETWEVTVELEAVCPGDHPSLVFLETDEGQAFPKTKLLSVNTSADVPALELEVLSPRLRYLSRDTMHIFKISNHGASKVPNVILEDVLSPANKFGSASHGGQFNSETGVVKWNIGEIEPGETKEVQLCVRLGAIGLTEQRVMLSANDKGIASWTPPYRVEGLTALFLEAVDVEDPVTVGEEVKYEIRVSNCGCTKANGLCLTCLLPEAMQFTGSDGLMSFQREGRIVQFFIPSLAPRADAICHVKAKALSAGQVRFKTELFCDEYLDSITKQEATRICND